MPRVVDLSPTVHLRSKLGSAAPLLVKADVRIHRLPLDRLVTLATVVDLTGRADYHTIDRGDLADVGLAGIDGCILRTDWCDSFASGEQRPAPVLTMEAASCMLGAGVRTVAADFPLIGSAEDLLMHNHCVLVYCLSNVRELSQPIVRLIALPPKLELAFSAEARVIAMEE